MSRMMRAWRSFWKNASVLKQKVKPGTAKRALLFAVPYAVLLTLFVFVVIVEAAISVANPLIYREIINKGILNGNSALVIHLALIAAALAGC